VTATTLNLIKRTSGAFGAASGSGAAFSSINGVAMAFGFDYDLAVTGVEAATLKPSFWTIVYGDGNDAPLEMTAGRKVAVALFDATNPADAVVFAVWT
jgi:hypothetical protein